MHSPRDRTHRRRFRRTLLRTLLAVVIVVPLLLAAAWLAVHHVPRWYAPPVVDAAEHQRVRDDMERVFNAMSAGLMRDRAFHLVLDQRQVNDWLVVGGELLPDLRSALTEVLEAPMVRFAEGRITAAGMVRHSGVRTIVGLEWELQFDPRTVRVRLVALRTGALRVPLAAVDAVLARLSPAGAAAGAREPAWIDSFRAALDGLEVENRFFWRNGERWFRILELEMRGSAIRLRIEPLS